MVEVKNKNSQSKLIVIFALVLGFVILIMLGNKVSAPTNMYNSTPKTTTQTQVTPQTNTNTTNTVDPTQSDPLRNPPNESCTPGHSMNVPPGTCESSDTSPNY